MSYVPPHKRHSKDAGERVPAPASLAPQFKQSLTLGSHRRNKDPRASSSDQGPKIIYAAGSISRWWPVGGGDDDTIPASFHLDPVSREPVERKTGGKPLILCVGREDHPAAGESGERPWVWIAERIEQELLASALRAKEGAGSETEENKLSFVARIGKVHFDRRVCLDSLRKAASADQTDSTNQVHKSFYTNLPSGYVEDIQHLVLPKIRLNFESEKEHYHVKIFDKSRPDSTISCKCTVAKDGKEIEIHKVELNPVRHLVVDLSCLYKDMDLRLMLAGKKILKKMDDEEKDCIEKLIKSAILDPDVKGGLRWPLGKESVSERFYIVGAWHVKYKDFRSPTMRLKLRHADRYDHKTSTGEVSDEVTLKLTGISKKLRDGDLETEPLMNMVQQEVKVIWDHFLAYSHLST